MEYKEKILLWWNNTKIFLSSSKGRDVVLYLIFIFTAFCFWSILVLNNQIQEHYKIKFNITDIPENVTIIDDTPKEISAAVKNSGYVLFKYIFGKTPEINASFGKFSDKKGNIIIRKQDIEGLLVEEFGAGTVIVSFDPELISAKYTTLPAKKLPLEVLGDFSANFQYVINGQVRVSDDSVLVYSDAQTLLNLSKMHTERFNVKELKDTAICKIAVAKIKNVKIVPDSITVVVPVEPLISTDSDVKIVPVNVPAGSRLIPFPAKVKASYNIPMSLYGDVKNSEFEAVVDYNDIKDGVMKLPIHIERAPKNYRNIALQHDSVEFIVEQL